MPTQPTIVLVHGAFLDGPGTWSRVRPLLEKAGHPVLVVNLPGRGGDGADPRSLSLDLYRDTVLRAVHDQPEPVILVGHSFGGMTISAVAEAAPERVRALVYLSAYLPQDGESMFDLAKTDADSHLGRPGNLVLAPDYSIAQISPDAKADVFANDAANDAERALIVGCLIAEPAAPQQQPVRLSAGRFGRVPKVYLLTTRDHCVSPALQEHMAGRVSGIKVVRIDAGHASAVTHPGEVARAILAAAAGAPAPIA